MKPERIFLFWLTCCSLLVACDNDEKAADIGGLITRDGTVVEYYVDSTLVVEEADLLRQNILPSATDSCRTGSAAVETSRRWVRMKFRGLGFERLGLSPVKDYLVRPLRCRQAIPDSAVVRVQPCSPRGSAMGFFSLGRGDCRLGYRLGAWSAGMRSAATTVLYIGYDAEGNKVGRYFPCAPEDLQWYYTTARNDIEWSR